MGKGRTWARAFVALGATVLVAACQAAGPGIKTGDDSIVLRFASIDNLDPNGQTPAPRAFITALQDLSGGKMKVDVTTEYRWGEPDAETALVHDIATGTLDGGWPATRAFSRAGMRGLESLEAPFVVTNLKTQQEIASGPVGADLLKTLQGSGMVGLGLSVGPLRRAWSNTEPLVDLDAWKGVTARSYNSVMADETYRALGAVPVAASFNFPDLVAAGKIHAVETDISQYAHNNYGPLLPHAVRNVVLWPRMLVLSLSQAAWDRLDEQQRQWVSAAAAQAVRSSVEYPYDEVAQAATLCKQGVRFVDASPEQVATLTAAVKPVLSRLAADATSGPLLERIEQIAAAHPAVDAPAVPKSCTAG